MNPVSSREQRGAEGSVPDRATPAPPFVEEARGHRYAGRTGDNSLGRALGYFILRLSLGVDMFMHLVVREWGVSQDFVPVTEKLFVGNLLPMSWVHYFLTYLPYFEGLLGVLLILGLWSRWAITAEGLLVTVLLFGTAIRSDWTVVSHQMIYLLFVFFLLAVEDWDYFSVDAWLARRRSPREGSGVRTQGTQGAVVAGDHPGSGVSFSATTVVIEGRVVKGLQGARHTLAAQIPLIAREFPEIEECYRGSINIELECGLDIGKHDHETELICWDGRAGERFSFLRIALEFPFGGAQHTAWIYTPHGSPHRQNRRHVEVIASKIKGLHYGSICRIHLPTAHIESLGSIQAQGCVATGPAAPQPQP